MNLLLTKCIMGEIFNFHKFFDSMIHIALVFILSQTLQFSKIFKNDKILKSIDLLKMNGKERFLGLKI